MYIDPKMNARQTTGNLKSKTALVRNQSRHHKISINMKVMNAEILLLLLVVVAVRRLLGFFSGLFKIEMAKVRYKFSIKSHIKVQ